MELLLPVYIDAAVADGIRNVGRSDGARGIHQLQLTILDHRGQAHAAVEQRGDLDELKRPS